MEFGVSVCEFFKGVRISLNIKVMDVTGFSSVGEGETFPKGKTVFEEENMMFVVKQSIS